MGWQPFAPGGHISLVLQLCLIGRGMAWQGRARMGPSGGVVLPTSDTVNHSVDHTSSFPYSFKFTKLNSS